MLLELATALLAQDALTAPSPATGVYCGISTPDYAEVLRGASAISSYSATGSAVRRVHAAPGSRVQGFSAKGFRV